MIWPIVATLGFFFYLFFSWRRLRDDYTSDRTFSAAFVIIGLIILSQILVWYFGLMYLWFWAAVASSVGAFVLVLKRFRFKFYESLEAFGVGLLIPYAAAFLAHGIASSRPDSLVGFLVVLAVFGLFFFLDKRYRRFTWYRSGRVGFSGLTVLGFLFLIRAVVALFFPSVLSFSGGLETVMSAVLAFVLFLLLYNLSQKSV